MTPCPRPQSRPKAPRARIKRTARIRCKGPTIAQKRAQRKADGPGVDPDSWQEICDFYTDAAGVVRCAYGCGRPATEQEHVVPLSRGGRHKPGNIVPADAGCNQRAEPEPLPAAEEP